MITKELIQKGHKLVNKAIIEFGKYSLMDKGPWEVMSESDIRNLVKSIKALSLEDQFKVLNGIENSRRDGMAIHLSDLLRMELNLEDNDPRDPWATVNVSSVGGLFTSLMKQDGFSEKDIQDKLNTK